MTQSLEKTGEKLPTLQDKAYVIQAWRMQKVAVSSEVIAIFIAYALIGKPMQDWFKFACIFMTCRTWLSISGIKNEKNFIISNLFSAVTWGLYGVYGAQLPGFEPLLCGLFLTGLCGGAILFLTYIRWIYSIYAIFTILPFGFLLANSSGVFFYVGVGLIILVVFLTFLSLDYNAFLTNFFLLNKNANDLIQQEKKSINELEELRASIDNTIRDSSRIEESILNSINSMQEKTNLALVNHDLFNIEIDHLINFIPQPVLVLGVGSRGFCFNNHCSALFRAQNTRVDSIDALIHLLEDKLVEGVVPLVYLIKHHNDYRLSGQSIKTIINTQGELITCYYEHLTFNNQVVTFVYFENQTLINEKNQALYQSKFIDSLTGLLSREGIHEHLGQMVVQARESGMLLGVAYLDFNNFKIINDNFGHIKGNIALIEVARRLQLFSNEDVIMGRLSGDEFILLVNNLMYKNELIDWLNKIQPSLSEPYVLEGISFDITFSIGLSFFPSDTQDEKKLIYYAELAMYEAKKNRTRTHFTKFYPKLLEDHNADNELRMKLSNALTNQEFFIVFQPIYDIQSKAYSKAEVLLRWKGNVGPHQFIPIAERLGMILDITLWVLKESCKARLNIAQKINHEVKFSVNISSSLIKHNILVEKLIQIILDSGCNPKWIEFELTESTLIDYSQADYFINKAHQSGISVSMDDFGTGYSSISNLKNLYFDSVKIDREFIKNIHHSASDRHIFESVIAFSKIHSAEITIEGVESKEQFELIQQYGCTHVQGYYFSKPVDFHTLIEKL